MGRHSTDFLFSRGSFLVGAGSVLNIAGSYFCYNRSSTPQQADERAIFSDWAMTGQDIQDAARTVALKPALADGDEA